MKADPNCKMEYSKGRAGPTAWFYGPQEWGGPIQLLPLCTWQLDYFPEPR
jgi:hypothetical protein